MITSSKRQILSLSIVFALMNPVSFSQENTCPEEKRMQAAVHLVKERLGLGYDDFSLQAALVPSLTDDVISLKETGSALKAGRETIVVWFYRVVPIIYELNGKRIVSENVEVDNNSEFLIAIDGENNKYLLQGSTDPIDDYNKFVKTLKLKVSNIEYAQELFDFFLKVAFDSKFRSGVLSDGMKLEMSVLEDFWTRSLKSKARADFTKWWKRYGKKAIRSIYPPKLIPMDDGYRIQFFTYSQGDIRLRSMIINSDGTIILGKDQMIVSGH